MKSLLILLIIFLFIIYNLKKCSSSCSFTQFDGKSPPLFVANFQEDSYSFLNGVDDILILEENIAVIGYCPGGIELVQNGKKVKSTTTEVIFSCKSDKLSLTVGNDSYFAGDSTDILACSQYGDLQLFERLDSDECNKRNYAVITYIADLIVILGESCFDMHNMRISNLHYKTRSSGSTFLYNIQSILKKKKLQKKVPGLTRTFESQFQPIESIDVDRTYRRLDSLQYGAGIPTILQMKRTQTHKLLSTTIPLKYFFYSDNDTQLLFPNQGQAIIFVASDLFPSDVYYPYFKNPFKNFNILQRFIGWPNIVNGNWRSFHKLLLLHSSSTGMYDIYLGTSHIAIAPNLEDECAKHIKLETGGTKMYVPKYIWAYIRATETDEEFVVIGVNSPYYKYYDLEKDFACKDICEDIKWLLPLYASRKVLTFGYMLCCPVETVHQHLEGFPNIKKKERLNFE